MLQPHAKISTMLNLERRSASNIGSSLKRVRIIASARQNAVQKEQIPEFIAIDGVLRI